ncbi:hypothetical protein SAMN05518866_13142 [Sphingobium sp. YR768]|nr:hypothetical protein SAMN05518866_13142 [Sphingobium sp. YR768]
MGRQPYTIARQEEGSAIFNKFSGVHLQDDWLASTNADISSRFYVWRQMHMMPGLR